jgi:HAD superfamily hydrolase (TIGR01459 family)
MTKLCQGISDISDSYDAFLIDQGGVLHDNKKAFPGVVECLKQLKQRKKTVVILSNSSMTPEQTKPVLKKAGIGPSLYKTIITSGGLIREGLGKRQEGVFENIGRRVYLPTSRADTSLIEDLDIEIVSDIEDADFMLITPEDTPESEDSEIDGILKKGVRQRLRAICANPDRSALMRSNFVMGPGLIARRYQEFGGVVHFIGKPHKPIFRHCISYLKHLGIYPGQTVVVGDTMAHDIVGGSMAEIDTCLVTSGIHAGVFKHLNDSQAIERALKGLAAQYGNISPTCMVPGLQWGQDLPDRKHKKRKAKSKPKSR